MATDRAPAPHPEAPSAQQRPASQVPGPGGGGVMAPSPVPDPQRPGQPLTERAAGSAPGVPVLVAAIVMVGVGVWLIVATRNVSGGAQGGLSLAIALLLTIGALMLSGLTP